MKILISKVVLIIPFSKSLKDKRKVVNGIKDRIWSRFRASISEIEENNSLQKAVLGIVYVSNDKSLLDSIINNIIDLVEASYPGVLHNYEYTIETY